MIKYEEETGRFAIWRGVVTESFKKWQKGEKIYEQDKERITILVSEEKKKEWLKYVEDTEYSSISKLIREAVDFYTKSKSNAPSIKTISRITHDLKEPLTLIKGFSQIIIENYKDNLDFDILLKIKDIFDQSLILDDRIKSISEDFEAHCDLLIIDDDVSTTKVLSNYFELKGYSVKIVSNGADVIDEMHRSNPKVILLDILLPDIDGYEVSKMIKSNDKFKDKLIFFITAIPRDEVEKNMIDLNVNGYFLKPFDFTEFQVLFQYL